MQVEEKERNLEINGNTVAYERLLTQNSFSFDRDYQDLDADVMTILSKVLLETDDESNDVTNPLQVGHFICQIFDIAPFLEFSGGLDSEFLLTVDSICDDDTFILEKVDELLKLKEVIPATGNMMVLKTLSINAEYRGKGIGAKVVAEIIKLAHFFNVDFLIAQLAPIEELPENQTRNDYIEYLSNFYEDNNFTVYQYLSDSKLEAVALYEI